jgi:hypothetical protein
MVLFFILLGLIGGEAGAYLVQYKEQYFRLFHIHYIQYPDDSMENIYWLERALEADFANPLYAIARIQNETEWEKYRYLFMMHANLKLIEQYLLLGNKWNKREAFFYNAPFRAQNLDSLTTAETCYRSALVYWKDAVEWAAKARERQFKYINLSALQFWEDEAYRIERGDLNYETTIRRELGFIEEVRLRFEAMDEDTY